MPRAFEKVTLKDGRSSLLLMISDGPAFIAGVKVDGRGKAIAPANHPENAQEELWIIEKTVIESRQAMRKVKGATALVEA